MRPFAHIASLVSMVLAAGCGVNNPSGTWDADPKTWEAAPPRQIVEGDAGIDDGGLPGNGSGGSGSFTNMCKMDHEPWCCFNGTTTHGDPMCSWRGLGPGESLTITQAYEIARPSDPLQPLPNPLTIRVVTRDKFESADDCMTRPVGFVVEGKGVSEMSSDSNVQYYFIKSDGKWSPAGADSNVSGCLLYTSDAADE